MTRPRLETEICIVGAGAAGCLLAHALARSGIRTIVLDAGGRTAASPAAIGMDSRFGQAVYSGATEGRYFGLGGSTAHWGGLLAPHDEANIEGNDPHDAAWRHIVDSAGAEAPRVLDILGFPGGPDFVERADAIGRDAVSALRGVGISTSAALHLPFRRKNLLWLLDAAAREAAPPHVVPQATAIGWQSDLARPTRIDSIRARACDGSEMEIGAHRFVIAAGALESARLLLELRESPAGKAIPATALIGQGLSDHLSLPIADVAEGDLALAASLFAPRFDGAWMRSFRMTAAHAPRSFAHFTFAMDGAGFRVAKELLQAVQRRSWPQTGLREAGRATAELTRIAWTRLARRRLHIATGAPTHLQLDIEQRPAAANQLRLGEERDRHGRRIPIIDWRIGEDDLARAEQLAALYLERWRSAGATLPALLPRPLSPASTKPHDAYHPAGLTRIGQDRAATVDRELRVHGFDNLFLVSTGVLPSPGTANPTFTMLCLANRLARSLGDANMPG